TDSRATRAVARAVAERAVERVTRRINTAPTIRGPRTRLVPARRVHAASRLWLSARRMAMRANGLTVSAERGVSQRKTGMDGVLDRVAKDCRRYERRAACRNLGLFETPPRTTPRQTSTQKPTESKGYPA